MDKIKFQPTRDDFNNLVDEFNDLNKRIILVAIIDFIPIIVLLTIAILK